MGNFLKRLFQGAARVDGETGTSHTPDDTIGKAAAMLRPVVTAYGQRYARYGATPEGVYWSNARNTKRRFEILSRVFHPADVARGGASINDLGCGYGALYDFLASHPVMRDGQYHGYDITRPLLDACTLRIKDPRAHFHHAMRATQTADYSMVSGTFNMSIRADEDRWLAYVLASLQDLWNRTGTAMAFNMLDIAEKTGPDGLYYADPAVFEDFCRNNLSDNMELVSGYGLPDFTILVRR